MSKPFLRTCARTIVLHDGKVLLLKNKFKDGVFWGFPGGVQVQLESLEECAVRETKEEANLDVELLKPLYLEEYIAPAKKHLVSLWFLAKPAKAADTTGISNTQDPDDEDRGRKILDVQWIPVEEISSLPMRPDHFLSILLQDYRRGFDHCLRKLPVSHVRSSNHRK
jgi:ADP-ribose pyrophosphatase YjhB (NUDIX family)